jgi:hypothetical protein
MSMMRRGIGCLVLLLAAMASGCSRSPGSYDASTADAALDSARQMIESGDAARLVELIYAEGAAERSFLNQFGRVLGALDDLGAAVEKRFPEELRQFREDADRAAAEGRTSPILSRLVAAGRGERRSSSFGTARINREGLTLDTGAPAPARRGGAAEMLTRPRSDSEREVINGVIKTLLVDPFRWLDEGRARLTTVSISDDTVGLLWDGKAILPPFGLSMIRRDGRWFLVPPTSFPIVSRAMPRTEDEWFVWGSMLKTLENVVVDLTAEVESGGVRNLTDLADTAVEKAAIPAMLIVFAYTNLVEQRNKAAAASPVGVEPAAGGAESAPAGGDEGP